MTLEIDNDYNDDFRVRSLRVEQTPITPFHIDVPQGIKSESSIGPVSPQYSPVLSQPNRNILAKVIDTHFETERLAQRCTDQFEVDVTQSLAKMNDLDAEKQEELRKAADAVKSESTWSTLSNVAQYVSGVGSVMLGYSIGGLPGAALMISGGVGMGVKLAKDTHLLNAFVEWKETSHELQNKLAHEIEMNAFYLQMGLGLAGGFAAWQNGALSSFNGTTLEAAKKVTGAITTGATILSTGAKIGQAVYQKKHSDAQANLKEINGMQTSQNHQIAEDTKTMSRMMEMSSHEIEEIKKAIQFLDVVEG